MFERENFNNKPQLLDISNYINNSLFDNFCNYMQETYNIRLLFEFSKCSLEYGWNIKFKKGSKSLCTIYPRENYFLILIVIGKKEKEKLEKILPTFSVDIQTLYNETKEGNNQKWLIFELEDDDRRYKDIKKIIDLRSN